jgi:uncharacterized phage protein (TIGR02220 family)
MADIHYFDVNVAMKYGVNCAVLLQNIWHWVKKNEANGTNFHDGYYWTYNSTRAFAELFPYLTKRQIEKALTTLKDDGIIKTGNYNALQYDRTLWYTVTEKGKCILLVGEMEITEKGNGNPPEVTPIPDINTNINPDNKPYIFIVDYLNEKAGTKYKATTPKTQAAINARLSEGFTVDDFQRVVDNKCAEWLGTEWEKYLRPETLFGTKFEGYLNARVSRKAISTGMNPEEDDLAGIF